LTNLPKTTIIFCEKILRKISEINKTKLEQGDYAYFDSSMGHDSISTEVKDAVIFWVSTQN